ncbi:U-box domain-containing protein 5-like [Cynara cardunculus var. scolymus]|uniref:U-box domain-containing protein 5-like n=1 Tax=Cynara cardunculus var. scolymus TaxID=59895 RepID=UPI000D627E47|nr:U-box domain-containing protein 5-like [Cynara cardunculus var. scolymus]
MQSITLEAVEHPYISTWKVHRLACLELKNIIDKITDIFTAIESARPRCSSGLEVLCSLHCCMEKCMLLLRHCSESSKLYLAISGERIILRCERIRNSLESCLSLFQGLVEPRLATQISRIVDYIETVAFTMDSSEDEAGKVLLALLHKDIAPSRFTNLEELMAFKFAALRLQITSPSTLVIEKRSIRKLLNKIRDTDPGKKKILNYFLYLTRKYGKSIKPQETGIAHPEGDDVFDSLEPPTKFRNRRLSELSSSSSIPSLSSSLGDLHLQVENASFRSSDTNSLDYSMVVAIENGCDKIQEKPKRFDGYSGPDNGTSLSILAKLSVLPWASMRRAVEDVKNQLKEDQRSHVLISTSYIKPVFKFLKEAYRLEDTGAKRHGAELLLIFLKECRTNVPPLPENAIYDLSLFLRSEIMEEALSILELLSCHQQYNSEIVAYGILPFLLELIKNPKSRYHDLTLRVLCNLSAHIDLGHHLIYLGFIQHLIPILDEVLFYGYCLKIFKNLCAIDEAATHFVEHDNCIVSIGELLEVGKDEEQEHALDILLDLCYQRDELRERAIQASITSCLVDISRHGSCKGRLLAAELLHVLGNTPDDRSLCTISDTSQSTNSNLKANKPCSKKSGLFGRIKAKFRKSVQ